MDTLKVKVGDKWLDVEVLEFSLNKAVFLVDGEQIAVTPSKVERGRDQNKNVPSIDTVLPKSFTAPMPGTVIEVLVKVGQQISSGDEVCILESMKMQQVLRSEVSGIVKSVEVSEGEQILDGHVIFELEA